ncbi:MAG: hypothetical protein EOM20_16350 [Spartobacteria bacterium]|nr:hypothetical protein [Spartobacteria bacterium]
MARYASPGKAKSLRNDESGQAMLEYALLTVIVVIASMASYMTGWMPGIRQQIHDILAVVSLPFP